MYLMYANLAKSAVLVILVQSTNSETFADLLALTYAHEIIPFSRTALPVKTSVCYGTLVFMRLMTNSLHDQDQQKERCNRNLVDRQKGHTSSPVRDRP